MLPRRTRRSVDTALCLIALCVLVRAAGAQLLFGCRYDGDLCLEDEQCVDDELFGQCQAPGAVTPTAYEITPDDLRVISDELTKLLDAGADWRDARTQCTVAYFVFCLRYELPYDGDFCAAQHPENIWALIHSIQGHLPPEAALGMSNRQSELVPVIIDEDQVGEGRGAVPYEVEAIEKRAMDESITSPAEVSVGDDAIDDYALEEQTALQPVYDDTAYDYAQYDQPVDTDNDYLESMQEQPTAYILEPIGVVDVDDEDDNGIENDYDPGMGEQVQPGPVTAIVSQVLSELPAPQATPIDEQVAEYDVVPFEQDDYVPVLEPDESDEIVGGADVTKRNGPDYAYDDDPVLLNLKEEQLLNKMLIDVMNGGQPDLTSLSNEQLDKFISYVELMQQLLDEQKNDQGGFTRGTSKRDYEDAGNFGANTNGEMALLKKDLERLGDVNQGLNRKHKIVKGDADKHRVERVEGDRVYIKLNKDLSEDREHLINLVNFLESDVANPMNMTFSDFSVSGPEISFKVTPLVSDYDEPAYYTDDMVEVDTPILPVTGVARAVYKRRSSVHKAANADIVETGVGDDTSPQLQGHSRPQGHVVIERNDNLLTAIVAVCLSVGSVLALVAGIYLYKQRELARTHVHRLSHDVEAAPSKAYEELCRQRMAKGHASQSGETVEPISGTGRAAPFAKDGGGGAAAEIDERHSSSSSWLD